LVLKVKIFFVDLISTVISTSYIRAKSMPIDAVLHLNPAA